MNKYDRAMKLAEDNYETWGQWVVECTDLENLKEQFIDHNGQEITLEEWVILRKKVASVYDDIQKTAF